MHTHQIIKDKKFDKQEVIYLEWDECTLIQCVRTVVKMKLKYNSYWSRSMKDDPIRHEIVGKYLM